MVCCKHFDKEKYKANALTAAKLAQVHASVCKDKAVELVNNSKELATPYVKNAWEQTVKTTAPRVSQAARKVAPVLETAHTKLTEEYIPRIDSVAKETTMKKSHPLRSLLLALAGLGAVAVAGVLVWRRLQPVDDPWAEEYWDDFEDECECGCEAATDAQELEAEK